MGLRGPKPRQSVSTEWSPKLAYAVGLITTDGCLSKDGRHIDFTSKDIQLIEEFKKCLGLKRNRVGFKYGGYSNIRYPRIQFGDVVFYAWLKHIGLTPRKSRILAAIKIPDRYFFDFLRGCFDGDGTIYSFWDRRWQDSFMFYISFASGSKPFLEWLRKCIKKLSGIDGHVGPGSRNTFQLKYAKEGTLALFQKMFYNKNLPHLKRKFLKARSIFKMHNEVVGRNKSARIMVMRGW